MVRNIYNKSLVIDYKSIKSMNEKAKKSYKIRNKNKIGIKLRNKK